MSGFLFVFLGAGIGGMLRHGVGMASLRILGSGFPHATMIVNVVGSFLMGVLVGWFAHRADPGQHWRLFLTTGLLGGFTTFSTFSLDAALLWERGQGPVALGYVLASVSLGVVSLFAGLTLVRQFA